MNVAEVLANAAQYVGLTPGEFASVLVSLFGSVAAVGAAVAAWFAADATSKSVTEMRTARLQSVQPNILASGDNEFAIDWHDAFRPGFVRTDRSPTLPSEPDAGLSFANIGSGPAFEFAVTATKDNQRVWTASDTERAQALFKLAGFDADYVDDLALRLVNAERMLLFSVYLRGTASTVEHVSLGTCASNETVRLTFNQLAESLLRASLEAVVEKDATARRTAESRWSLEVKYKSNAGEVFTRHFVLVIEMPSQIFFDHNGFVSYDIPNRRWTRMRVECRADLREVTTVRHSWFEMIKMKLGSRIQSKRH